MHSEIPWITNLVCETHITWSMSASENCKNLLVMMELASAKPNREWSVNRVWSPIVRAWRSASWHKVEKALKRSQNNERQIHVHVSYLQKRFLPKKKKQKANRGKILSSQKSILLYTCSCRFYLSMTGFEGKIPKCHQSKRSFNTELCMRLKINDH